MDLVQPDMSGGDMSSDNNSLASLGFADPVVYPPNLLNSLENDQEFLANGSKAGNEAANDAGKDGRGSYKCSRCGMPKKGHGKCRLRKRII